MYRVTFRNSFVNMTQNLMQSARDMALLNRQASTGLRVYLPSDDPVAMVTILGRRRTLNAMNQYQRNIDMANSWLKSADTAMTGARILIGTPASM